MPCIQDNYMYDKPLKFHSKMLQTIFSDIFIFILFHRISGWIFHPNHLLGKPYFLWKVKVIF